MKWNNAFMKKKFDEYKEKMIAEYKAAGMTDEQIAEMVKFDEEQFRSDRRYCMHTQPLIEGDFGDEDEDTADDGKSPLLERNLTALSVTIDDEKPKDSFWWMQEINNKELLKKLKALSCAELDLLKRYVLDGETQGEIAEHNGCSEQNIQKFLQKIKKSLQ